MAALLREAALRAGAQAVLFELDRLADAAAGRSLDTQALEVRLQTHPVLLGRDHAYLMVIVDRHPAFEDDPRFQSVLPDGRRYATLGAGPRGMNPFFSTLESKVNRAWDANLLLPDSQDVTIQHPEVAAGRMTEREAVDLLFSADAAYDDAMPYDIVPFTWSSGYNSNSYLSGLLQVTGWRPDRPEDVPGWDKPLPPEAFGR